MTKTAQTAQILTFGELPLKITGNETIGLLLGGQAEIVWDGHDDNPPEIREVHLRTKTDALVEVEAHDPVYGLIRNAVVNYLKPVARRRPAAREDVDSPDAAV
jgi:hypothetical protein